MMNKNEILVLLYDTNEKYYKKKAEHSKLMKTLHEKSFDNASDDDMKQHKNIKLKIYLLEKKLEVLSNIIKVDDGRNVSIAPENDVQQMLNNFEKTSVEQKHKLHANEIEEEDAKMLELETRKMYKEIIKLLKTILEK